MTKRILLYAMCLVMLLSATSCSKEEKAKEEPTKIAKVEADKTKSEPSNTEPDKNNSEKDDESGGTDIEPGQGFKIPHIEPVKTPNIRFDPIEPMHIDLSVESVGGVNSSKFDKLTEAQKAEIKKQYAEVINDIQSAFETAGFEIKINRSTGEIDVDASVLFATDKHEVTDAGKTYLKDFLKAYVPVIAKHSDFIANVMVEGHTDTDGKYDYNMELSKKRAENVLSFCKSDKSGLDKNSLSTVKSKFKAVGRSYDNPIYTNGKVDKAASRRVSFRMLINI